MPDIKGGLNRILCSVEQEGCFYGVDEIKAQIASENTSNQGVFHNIMFDAQRSNSIYGNSDTVQPPAISLIPQIKF